jgi:mRNA interferase MazF
VDVVIKRFGVYLVALDPIVGSEIKKARPCVVVSPDEINFHLHTVIVAPLTSTLRSYPFRVPSAFQGKRGQVALDQIRAVDKSRLIRRLGTIDAAAQARILEVLQEMFAP